MKIANLVSEKKKNQDATGKNYRRIFGNDAFLIAIYTISILCLGLFIVQDYGVSYDEEARIEYAYNSANAYQFWFDRSFEPNYEPMLMRYSGASSDVIVVFLIKIIQKVAPSISKIDIWHYSYFVFFVITGLSLYGLAKRWLSRWASWGILFLFTSQPLIWGHAFINHADIPFMGLFVLTIYSGFSLADSLPDASNPEPRNTVCTITTAIKQFDWRKKKGILVPWLVWLFLLLLVVLSNSFHSLVDYIIRFFYYAAPDSWASKIFHLFAQYSSVLPVDYYIEKLQSIVISLEIAVLFISIVILAGRFIFKRRGNERNTFQGFVKLILDTLKKIFMPKVIFAGIIFGLTISMRILGPLAGLIVVLYILVKARRKAFSVLFAYALWGILIAYITWPYLWQSPLAHYLESVKIVSRFPWPGTVLFNGKYYLATELPWYYLPLLLNIQLTETFLLFFYFGFGLLIWQLRYKKIRSDALIYIGAGLLFPLFVLIVTHTPFYDNFRHILFLLPPLFLIAGFGVDFIMSRINWTWCKVALVIILAIPGILSGAYLHPYEYIYYNRFIGYTEGAFRRFETDYWMISFREVAEYLNDEAEPNAKIMAWNGAHLLTPYTRPDLLVEREGENTYDLTGGYDYAVLSSRHEYDALYPDGISVFSVKRGDVLLVVVKRLSAQSAP